MKSKQMYKITSFIEKVIIAQLGEIFPAIYRVERFIAVLKAASTPHFFKTIFVMFTTITWKNAPISFPVCVYPLVTSQELLKGFSRNFTSETFTKNLLTYFNFSSNWTTVTIK
jgi:hypothetical protein